MSERLQFTHKSGPFSSREDAYDYVKKYANGEIDGREPLFGEPIVVAYYDKGLVSKPELILAIGGTIPYGISKYQIFNQLILDGYVFN